MLAGILLALAGLFGGWFVGLFYKDFDYKNIKSEDLGKEIRTDIKVYYDQLNMQGKALQLFGDMEGDSAFLLLDLSLTGEKGERLYYSKYLQHITISGRLRAISDAEFKELCEKLYEEYDPYYYIL